MRRLSSPTVRARLATLLALGLTGTSCATEPTSGPLVWSSVRQSVVGQALAALDSADRFVLTAEPQTSVEISESRARELALGWVNSLAPFVRGYLERQRRASVDVSDLRPCGRTYYAQSPYVIRTDAAPLWVLRPYAAWWIVTLCTGGGEPQVSLAVSTLNQHLELNDGLLRISTTAAGNEFVYMGIPVRWGELVISPEEAVQELATLSGRRVALPPRLVIRGDGPVPNLAQWELTLDTAVTGETELGRQDARTFYVSVGRTPYQTELKRGRYLISLPAARQATEVTVRYPLLDATTGNPTDWNTVRISRDGAPVSFIPTIVQSSRVP